MKENKFKNWLAAMPAPVVDYRKFRFSKINNPEFSHIKLLGGWIVYLVCYFLTEQLIPASECHVIHCAIDDIIPFNEYFLLFYCLWYVLIVISLLYFFLYDISSFRHLQIFIMVTQAAAMAFYIVYPSIQIGRPEIMPHDNFLCELMTFIYAIDTPTGVCPSLHVAFSMGIASVWVKDRKAPFWWKAFIIFATAMISISVLFVKQHSAIDVLAAIPTGLLAEFFVYNRESRKLRKLSRKRFKMIADKLGKKLSLSHRWREEVHQ